MLCLVMAVERGKKWVGEGDGGCYPCSQNVVCMYPTGGLMLKKKLLSLMIVLVVILNHLGVIHLWIFCFRIITNLLFERNKLSHTSVDRQSKYMALVIVYFGILYDRMPLILIITRRDCHLNAANLIFM